MYVYTYTRIYVGRDNQVKMFDKNHVQANPSKATAYGRTNFGRVRGVWSRRGLPEVAYTVTEKSVQLTA